MNKLSNYEVLSMMGMGSFGTCLKVRNKLTDKILVWKAVDYKGFNEKKMRCLVTEINLLKQLSHPSILQYFNYILDDNTMMMYIIMECCEGDLSMLIRRCVMETSHLEEQFVWRVLYQLSRAIQEYHSSMNILHRDIKPANVFLDAVGNIKLGNFGFARVLKGDDNFAESVVGATYYLSPEIIRGTKYNRKTDIWSLGCLVYELCALVPPFTGRDMTSLYKNINDVRFNRIPDMYSCDIQGIINLLLNVESGSRPSIEVLLHRLAKVSNVVTSDCSLPKLIPNVPLTNHFNTNPDVSSTHQNNTEDLRKVLAARLAHSGRQEICLKNDLGHEPGEKRDLIQKSDLDCANCACLELALLQRERHIRNLQGLVKEQTINDKRLNQKSANGTSNKENSMVSIESKAVKFSSKVLKQPQELKSPLKQEIAVDPVNSEMRGTTKHLEKEYNQGRGSDHINLTVLGQVLQFKIKKTIPFRKLMNVYCKQTGLSMQAVQFLYQGQLINENDTPYALKMAKDDTIDIYLSEKTFWQ